MQKASLEWRDARICFSLKVFYLAFVADSATSSVLDAPVSLVFEILLLSMDLYSPAKSEIEDTFSVSRIRLEIASKEMLRSGRVASR